MDNKELELKIKEILAEENFFDLIEKAVEFEKEYKATDFYKKTKMPLLTVIEKAKLFYLINLDDLFAKLQEKINGLNLDNIGAVLDQIGSIFENENSDMMNTIKEFSKLNN